MKFQEQGEKKKSEKENRHQKKLQFHMVKSLLGHVKKSAQSHLKKKFFTMAVIKHQNKLPREVMMPHACQCSHEGNRESTVGTPRLSMLLMGAIS